MAGSQTDISANRLLTEDEKKNYFEQQEYMLFIRNKIDSDIGYNYWKNYIVSSFWSNIATPLNLTITFLTAITTAQSQNTSLLPQNIYSNVTIINLIITTLITFFRPHEQFNVYSEYVKKWTELGVDLEKEYSTKASALNNENLRFYHIHKLETKIACYRNIQERCVNLRKTENTIVNTATDLIFMIVYYLCMCRIYYGPKKWLDYDKKIHRDALKELGSSSSKGGYVIGGTSTNMQTSPSLMNLQVVPMPRARPDITPPPSPGSWLRGSSVVFPPLTLESGQGKEDATAPENTIVDVRR